MTEVGNKLRQWRNDQGWTLEEVSDLVGLTISALSRMERGERNVPPATRTRIARRLGVPARDLFDIDDDEAVSPEGDNPTTEDAVLLGRMPTISVIHSSEVEVKIRSRFVALRLALGWSQEEAATKAEFVSQSWLSRMERGQLKLTLEVAARLAEVYGVTLADLLQSKPVRLTIEV